MVDVNRIVPLDVCAPESPASPEDLMHAILTLHEQIRTGELMQRRKEGRPSAIDPQQSPWTPDIPVAVRMSTPK
jgi:NADH-quinone oxidoreductase subunit B